MLSTLRDHYEVGNVAFANWTGVSIDSMKSVSMGRRAMTLDQFQQLEVLHQALHLEVPTSELPHAQQLANSQQQELPALLAAILQRLERSIEAKEAALGQKLARRDQLLRGYNGSKELLEEAEISEEHASWLALRIKHLLQKLNDMSTTDGPGLHTFTLAFQKSELRALQTQLQVLQEELAGQIV